MIIDSLRAGGKERQYVTLFKGLKKNPEIEIQLVLFRNKIYYKELNQLNTHILFLDKDKYCKFCKLYKIIKEVKPDIIHTWGFKSTKFSIPFAKLCKIKLLNSSIRYATHIKKFSKLWLMGKLTFPFSDIVIANSKAGLRAHRLKESKKYRYIYNGFDFGRITNKTSNERIKKEINVKTRYIVGMVGRFAISKDYKTFIQAAQLILRKRYDVTFLCVGNGPNLKNMQNLVDEKYKKFILFLGYRQDVERIIKIFDIGVLTTNTNGFAEGISNAIMEYMALEKPVIATDAGGNKELVVNGKTGYLIESFNSEILAEKICYLLNNKSLRESMCRKGKERLEKFFSLDRMVSDFSKIYKDLVKN